MRRPRAREQRAWPPAPRSGKRREGPSLEPSAGTTALPQPGLALPVSRPRETQFLLSLSFVVPCQSHPAGLIPPDAPLSLSDLPESKRPLLGGAGVKGRPSTPLVAAARICSVPAMSYPRGALVLQDQLRFLRACRGLPTFWRGVGGSPSSLRSFDGNPWGFTSLHCPSDECDGWIPGRLPVSLRDSRGTSIVIKCPDFF